MHGFNRTLLAFVAPVLAAVAVAGSALAQDLSTSIMRPSPIDPASGRVTGTLPGAAGPVSYYLAVDLVPGRLTTQLEVTGRPQGERRVTLQLLDAEARIAASTFVRAGFGSKDEKT
ncbi:hypothetical protein, partial [Rhodoplanes sp. SY1]|uniref:hypothetical protein n=1 Tax=Rhodoplanes sp. SY1 TaxID=3166646 RepID=UPI0038B60F8A